MLRTRYDQSAAAIEIALTKLLEVADIVMDAPELVRWALLCAVDGADFADMILLVAARDCERFATFDRAIPRDLAGAPVPVELLS